MLTLIVLPFIWYYDNTITVPFYGGVYREGMLGTPRNINPILLRDNDVDADIARLIYSGLMKRTEDGSITTDLARNYSVSDDGLEYTFLLKENIFWHNYIPFTADDVVFTIAAIQNPEYQSPQLINWLGVEVEKKDDYTVVFKLKNRYAQFLNSTTVGILPKHIWQSVKPGDVRTTSLNIVPIGTGPYRFIRAEREEGILGRIILKDHEAYHFGKPFITEIRFVFFDSQENMIKSYNNDDIDGMQFVSPALYEQVDSDGTTYVYEMPRYYGLFINQSESRPLSDKGVRQALNYATDVDELIAEVLDGHGSRVTSPLLPGIINIPQPTFSYSYDPTKAAQLLDASGWVVQEDGLRAKPLPTTTTAPTIQKTTLEVTITTTQLPELVKTAQLLQKQWQEVGIITHIKSLPVVEIEQQAIKERDYEILLFGEAMELNPDPYSFWHSSRKSDPGLNLARYDNESANRLMEDARRLINFEDRIAKYSALQEMIIEDAPAVFLYSPDYIYPQKTNVHRIANTTISLPPDRFEHIQEWYMITRRIFK